MHSYSRTQKNITLSSTESEYVALVAGASEGLLLKSVLENLTGMAIRLVMWCDNSAAVAICHREGVGKIKHLDGKLMWLQQRVGRGDIEIRRVPTKWNPADLGTKSLTGARVRLLLFLMNFTNADDSLGQQEFAIEIHKEESKEMLRKVRRLVSEEQHVEEKSIASNQVAKKLLRVTLFALLSQVGSALGQHDVNIDQKTEVSKIQWFFVELDNFIETFEINNPVYMIVNVLVNFMKWYMWVMVEGVVVLATVATMLLVVGWWFDLLPTRAEVHFFIYREMGTSGVKRYLRALVKLPWFLAEESVRGQVLELTEMVQDEMRKGRRVRRTLRRNGMKVTGARPLHGVLPHELETMTPTSSEAGSDEFSLDRDGMNLNRAMKEGRVGQVTLYSDEQKAKHRVYLNELRGRPYKTTTRILEEIKAHENWQDEILPDEDPLQFEEAVKKDLKDLYHEFFLNNMKVFGREKAILETHRWINAQVRNDELCPIFELPEDEERRNPMRAEEKIFISVVSALMMPSEQQPRRVGLAWDEESESRVVITMEYKEKPKVSFTQFFDERSELMEEFWLRTARLAWHLCVSASLGHMGRELSDGRDLWLVTRHSRQWQIEHFTEVLLRDIEHAKTEADRMDVEGEDVAFARRVRQRA